MGEKTLRFLNFLLDSIIFIILLAIFWLIFKNVVNRENVKWISFVLFFLYYFLFEYFTGQTPGKIITKTSVISLSNNRDYYFIRIICRTLMRFIIFDPLSYLFTDRGLHDRISKTNVKKL
jgi:uncharacterized RDD family membrane protein YckC